MDELKPTEYMDTLWERINKGRREFQRFINYEWNYAVHMSFHKHYETKVKNTDKLVRQYLKHLRKIRDDRKLTFSAFYIIPRSNIDRELNPRHIHILLLIYNEQPRLKITLKDSTTKFSEISRCKVHQLYCPEVGIGYLTQFKNLPLTDIDNLYFDFYREQLLKKWRNPTAYIHDQFERAASNRM